MYDIGRWRPGHYLQSSSHQCNGDNEGNAYLQVAAPPSLAKQRPPQMAMYAWRCILGP